MYHMPLKTIASIALTIFPLLFVTLLTASLPIPLRTVIEGVVQYAAVIASQSLEIKILPYGQSADLLKEDTS